MAWPAEVEEPTDVGASRTRVSVFIDLIGDHPIDSYRHADFQAFVDLISRYPANGRKQKACRGMSTRGIVLGRRAPGYDDVDPRHVQTFAKNTIKNAYLANVVTAIGSWIDPEGELEPVTPLPLKTLRYSQICSPAIGGDGAPQQVIVDCFEAAVRTGRLSEIVLFPLALLTTRRLGLLVHHTGSDIRRQFGSKDAPIFTTAMTEYVERNGQQVRRPIKTSETEQTFVYHRILHEVGLVEWMQSRGNAYVFEALHLYDDPEGNASKRMGRIVGAARKADEVFHGLRGTGIDLCADSVTKGSRTVRQQSGHTGKDVHEQSYGSRGLTESRARELCAIPLPE